LRTAFSARGTRSPIVAQMIAASSDSGCISLDPPAQVAPRLRAKDWVPTSPGRVKANTVRPCHLATCATIWAAAPSHRGPASCQRRRPGRGRVAGSHVGVQGVGGSESSQFPQLRRRHVGTGGGGFADETRRTSLAFANLIGGSKSMSTNTRRISAQQS
jgi:hypothetical protein